MMNLVKLFLTALLGTFFILACSAPEPKKVDSKVKSNKPVDECTVEDSSDDSKEDDENSSEEEGTDDNADDDAESGDDSNDNEAELNLLQTNEYYGDIKTLIDGKCATSGCHAAGAVSPDLSTFSGARDNTTRSIARMNDAANPMPPGGQLPQADRDLFQAWIDANTPEGTAPADDGGTDDAGTDDTADSGTGDDSGTTDDGTDDSSGDNDGDDSDDKSGNCEDVTVSGGDGSDDGPTTSDDPLLKKDEVEKCHEDGVVFDYNENACGTQRIKISYDCNRASIIEVFGENGIDAEAILTKSLGDPSDEDDTGEGFVISQCAKDSEGAPYVILVRVLGPPEPPGLKVRVLSIE